MRHISVTICCECFGAFGGESFPEADKWSLLAVHAAQSAGLGSDNLGEWFFGYRVCGSVREVHLSRKERLIVFGLGKQASLPRSRKAPLGRREKSGVRVVAPLQSQALTCMSIFILRDERMYIWLARRASLEGPWDSRVSGFCCS